MIFQNFGFNRVIKKAAASGPNYVSGASVIYDAGYSTSYPGSGTTIYDVSGNGNNGTLAGSPTFTTNYLSFNGSNQRITYSGYFNSAFTVQMYWRQPTSGGKTYPGLASQYQNNGVVLGVDTGWPNSSGVFAQWWYGASGNTGGNAYIDVSAGIDIRNNWTLFTLSSNGTNSYKYYVDSTNVATNTTTYDRTLYTPTNQTVYLAYNASNSEYQLGDMMAYLVYPYQLSDSEVTQNYNIFNAR